LAFVCGWFPHLFNRPTDVLIKWENTMQKQNCCSEFRQQFALISKSYLQGWRGLTVELSSIQILSKPSMQPKTMHPTQGTFMPLPLIRTIFLSEISASCNLGAPDDRAWRDVVGNVCEASNSAPERKRP